VAGIKNPLSISHILYVLGRGSYSEVYTVDGKHVLSSMTLKLIEEQSKELIRIHKNALVNGAFIDQATPHILLKKGVSAFVTMRDGRLLPVARRRWTVLFALDKCEAIE
ncbi:MAG: LytTR family transcriptional regulator, partial [Pedobacter sp.]